MIIGVLSIEIEIPHANSLKEKRAVLNRIKSRVSNKYNVSIAEIGDHDIWNYTELGISCVSNDQKHANSMLSKVAAFIETLHDFIVVDISMEFLHV